MKGGIGSASIDLGGGLIAGAVVAVNSVGSALMPDGTTYWAWPFELDGEFGASKPPGAQTDMGNPEPDGSRLLDPGNPGANTTLGVVACNAALTTAECRRVAMMAQDGIARAVRPSHSLFDGDTVFALASCAVTLDEGQRRAIQVSRIGSAAADCLSRAIARAVYRSRA